MHPTLLQLRQRLVDEVAVVFSQPVAENLVRNRDVQCVVVSPRQGRRSKPRVETVWIELRLEPGQNSFPEIHGNSVNVLPGRRWRDFTCTATRDHCHPPRVFHTVFHNCGKPKIRFIEGQIAQSLRQATREAGGEVSERRGQYSTGLESVQRRRFRATVNTKTKTILTKTKRKHIQQMQAPTDHPRGREAELAHALARRVGGSKGAATARA